MVNHIGGGDLTPYLMSFVNKMVGPLSSRGGFQDYSFAFPDWKYADERHKWKKKVKKNAQFPFLLTNESFPLWNCLSSNSNWFSLRRFRELSLFWTNRGSEVTEETWGTFCTPWSRKVRFQKEVFMLIKVAWTSSTFWHRRERKISKCAFEVKFFAMCSADLTCMNGSRIQSGCLYFGESKNRFLA